jgi:hypothetical protein
VELEIEGSAGAALIGLGWGILRHPQKVDAGVPRATDIGVEEKRRLVVTGIRAPVSYGVIDLGAENSTLIAAIKSVFPGEVL